MEVEEKGKKQGSQVEKLAYESPVIEVIEVENEGVIASSSGGNGHDVPFA